MYKFDINIKPYGPQAILVEWPNKIDDQILDDIIQFTSTILSNEKEDLVNYTPGYNSLLLQYSSEVNFNIKKNQILQLYNSPQKILDHIPKDWHIPVCYDDQFGLDISVFAKNGLHKKEVIKLHTSSLFRVYMIGFLPGFLYLGGLPKALIMDRKDTPRSLVPKGSVAIGGQQTGIYPMASPGGWQIIGRTPLTLFDLNKDAPTPIRQGDNIQFYEIDLDTYQNLSSHES